MASKIDPKTDYNDFLVDAWNALSNAWNHVNDAYYTYGSFSNREEKTQDLERLRRLITEAQELADELKME